MVQLPDLSLEQTFSKKLVAGIDEAGRGPWAGPVVAAAVIVDKNTIPPGINDSKKISQEMREMLYPLIMNNFKVGVGIISETVIDQINILEATKLAMKQAVAALSVLPDVLLVDGNSAFETNCQIRTVIGGDALSISIASASIIAKVTRDRIMAELHQHFPQYGWNTNFGYGTRYHIEAIQKYGPSPYHRRSFSPISRYFPEFNTEKQAKNGRERRMDKKTGWLFEDF